MAIVPGPQIPTEASPGTPGLAAGEGGDYWVFPVAVMDQLDNDAILLESGQYGAPTANLGGGTSEDSWVYWAWDCEVTGEYVVDGALSIFQQIEDRNQWLSWEAQVATRQTASQLINDMDARTFHAGTRYYFRVHGYYMDANYNPFFADTFAVLRISTPGLTSDWYQPPTKTVAMASPNGVNQTYNMTGDHVVDDSWDWHYEPYANGSGDAPYGRLTWWGCVDGPWPQDKRPNSDDLAWKGARSADTSQIYWNANFSAYEYIGDPAELPLDIGIRRGGVANRIPRYEVVWGDSFNLRPDHQLGAAIFGVRFYLPYEALTQFAGPLADQRQANDYSLRDPYDAYYADIFEPGASRIELEDTSPTIVDLRVAPDEWRENEYLHQYLQDDAARRGSKDQSGVVWGFNYEVEPQPSDGSPPQWGFYKDVAFEDEPQYGTRSFFGTIPNGRPETYFNDFLFSMGTFNGVSYDQWGTIPWQENKANRGVLEFILWPAAGMVETAPHFESELPGEPDSTQVVGEWHRSRTVPLVSARPTFQPTRVRAVYAPRVLDAAPAYPTVEGAEEPEVIDIEDGLGQFMRSY